MSTQSTPVSCTGCGFSGVIVHRPVRVIYRLDDGSEIETGRELGWCANCEGIADIEWRGDPAQIRREIQEIERREKTVVKRLLSRLFPNRENDKRQALSHLRSLLKFAEGRKSNSRCLKCGGESTSRLRFNEQGVSLDFAHGCGGRLKWEQPHADSPRIHFKRVTIYLDADGRKLDPV
jgi:hypothetical protein